MVTDIKFIKNVLHCNFTVFCFNVVSKHNPKTLSHFKCVHIFKFKKYKNLRR